MVISFIKNIIALLSLIFLQVAIFNKINISTYVFPYVYILFLFALPKKMPLWLNLITAFILGLSIDIFTNTFGIHALACTTMIFFKPLLLNSLLPQDLEDENLQANVYNLGVKKYLIYSSSLTLIHHFIIFTFEVFSIFNIFDTILKTIISSSITLFIILILQYIFIKKTL
jgi:rod shape-determining protein MreD